MEDLKIRQIVPGDEAAINEFFSVMGSEARAFFNRHEGNQKNTLRFCREQNVEDCRYWMAEDEEGRMCGLVFLWELKTSVPWLGIAVREELKGRHLGRRLIAFAQDYAKENGKGGIQLTTHLANLRGQVLYETMGFERIGMHGASGEWYYLFRYGR